jgi:hypothetical protein
MADAGPFVAAAIDRGLIVDLLGMHRRPVTRHS